MIPSARSLSAWFLAGLWINGSEFLRNEVILKTRWVAHFHSLGLTFPSAPRNGLVWVLWGFLFAAAVLVISRRFNGWETTLLAWLVGFVLMWVVTWNLSVLPPGLLLVAIPLSLIETGGAAFICRRLGSGLAPGSRP